ncbi:hypothetical protein GCM10009413_00510 [Tatumella punctata]
MYLVEKDFPISVRSTNQKYAIFNPKGKCVLTIKKNDWGKFAPNPALTNYCTDLEYPQIQYSSVLWIKNHLSIDSGYTQLIDISIKAMNQGLIPDSFNFQYMRILLQLAMATI